MAAITKFSSIIPVKGGKAFVSVGNLDTQFETGLSAVTTLSAVSDRISTTLDAPIGAVLGYKSIGFSILAGHTLNMAGGDDSLDVIQGSAVGAIGMNIGLSGTFDFGAGNDKIVFVLTGSDSIGINNQGKFLTGAGLEILKFEGALHGLVNGSTTNTAALIDTGAQDDKLDVISSSGNAIENYGTLTMGQSTENNTDKLSGNSGGHPLIPAGPSYTPGKFGIYNTGVVNMGGGGDVVDALTGGFGGGGTYNLGWSKTVGTVTTQDADNDAVSGFGWGTFNGGGGRNGITLPDGTYRINYTTAPLTLRDLASGTVQRSGDGGVTWNVNPGTVNITTMTFNGFDGIGGSGLNAGLHFVDVNPVTGATKLLQNLTIDTLGQVTAATYL